MEATIKEIAKNTLNIETLEIRGSGFLDFHDLSVWQIKEALEKAYQAGKKEVEKKVGDVSIRMPNYYQGRK